eukprot:CAMPEP_0204586642 /NCGR_PEP_ID=MMETSP0661-20131031/47609_1 /ASSEMBLY_ACC=CAM_ASM_000606 /TAXON_ID=109239 /ORGANISM="Alexandrium margalefi, Strain AMGDE01CS-322" /LENGTH=788 /DNA_ID=CAMNT_0051596297 /DNA_START=52 /DNA_END=2419 /DNA_ORIENTATION=-
MTPGRALAGFLLSVLAVREVGADDQHCTTDRDGQKLCSNSMLQSRATKTRSQVELSEGPAAWTASPFGDCMPDCGSKKFRSVTCANIYDGTPAASDAVCAGPKPSSSMDCVCGGGEACAPAPAAGCPTSSSGDNALLGANGLRASFEEVGCFDFKAPDGVDGTDDYHDMTCMTWKSEDLCLSGLPFYSLQDTVMDTQACFRFCLSKGMDIFGLLGDKTCRCGATALNKEVWHEEVPRPGLPFNPAMMKKPPQGCPVKVFRYKGHYEDDGVPSRHWDIKEGDLEYVDSVVTGKKVGEATEEDGLPEDQMVNGMDLAQEQAEQAIPGFQRPCWPGNCGPGRGPWRDRQPSPPPDNPQDAWKEYVVIKYAFDDSTGSAVDDGRKSGFRAAVAEWRNKTCINLIEQSTMPTGAHIKVGIYDTGSCYLSGMGYGTSRINLGWCNSMRYLGSMIHEIGHAIGMNHEQKRPDATTNYHGHGPFLTMYWDQIPSRWRPQYLKADSSYTGSANDGPEDPHSGWAPYDFGSIMHYPGGNRYDTVPTDKERLVGNRMTLTIGDIDQINDMYQCHQRCSGGACPTRAPTPVPTPAPPTPPPRYALKTSGSCQYSVTTMAECGAAASALSLSDTSPSDDNQPNGVTYDPPYCYFEGNSLKFNGGKNTGPCSQSDNCLCDLVAPSPTPAPPVAAPTPVPPTAPPTPFPTAFPTVQPTPEPTPEPTPLPTPQPPIVLPGPPGPPGVMGPPGPPGKCTPLPGLLAPQAHPDEPRALAPLGRTHRRLSAGWAAHALAVLRHPTKP